MLSMLMSVALQIEAQTATNAGSVLNEVRSNSIANKERADYKNINKLVPRTQSSENADSVNDSAALAKVRVDQIMVDGATVFSESKLQPLVQPAVGDASSLFALREAARRITEYYRQRGYFLAKAVVPEQEMSQGVARILVLEGRLSDIRIQNTSKVPDRILQSVLSSTGVGSALQTQALDRALLLASDIPGVGPVKSSLEAGSKTGETVLNVQVKGVEAWGGKLTVDNHGSPSTGRNRLALDVHGNSALGLGERLEARVQTTDSDLWYGTLDAELPLGWQGLSLGMGLSRNTYTLGDSFADLGISGVSRSGQLQLRYPVWRSPQATTYMSFGTESSYLYDEMLELNEVNEKRSRASLLNVSGNWRDTLWGDSSSSWSLGFTTGRLTIESEQALAQDAVAAQTAGRYAKWSWSVARQQALNNKWTLGAQLRGQKASKNLDSAEKFSLGGVNGVRAYSSGEVSGDEGWLASVNLNYSVRPWLVVGVFHDTGRVKVNAKPYLDATNNERRSGTGLSVHGSQGPWHWQALLAWRGSEVTKPDTDRKPRLWLQADWQF